MKNKALIVGIASLIYGVIKDLAILISSKQSMLEFLEKYLEAIFIVIGLVLIIYSWLDKKYKAIEFRLKETNDSIKKTHDELFEYAHDIKNEMRDSFSKRATLKQLDDVRKMVSQNSKSLNHNQQYKSKK